VLCVQDKTWMFFLPLSVITHVINVLNGIWRHHLLSNKVGQNSCPLILDNKHSMFSVICVRFMYKYFFFLFLIRRRLSFLKTFFVMFNFGAKRCMFTGKKVPTILNYCLQVVYRSTLIIFLCLTILIKFWLRCLYHHYYLFACLSNICCSVHLFVT